MSRIPEIRSVDDYPVALDGEERAVLQAAIDALKTYAATYAADGAEPRIPNSMAATLHSPVVAQKISDLSDHMMNHLPWGQRKKDRELMILLVNKRLKNEYAFRAHSMFGGAAGLSTAQIANLDFYETSDLFDEQERTVLRFTSAALDGEIPDALFEEARAIYGTKELMEFIIAIAYWTFWAVILNCTRPEVDFA